MSPALAATREWFSTGMPKACEKAAGHAFSIPVRPADRESPTTQSER
jgi:hypothetical protein